MTLRLLALRSLLLLCCLAGLASATEPTKLAVLYFESSGNAELAPLRLGLAQMLISDLSGTGRYDVLERTRLNELLAELEFQKSANVDQATAVGMGKQIGAHYLVMGAYFELMGTLRMDARVVEVETGRVVSVGTSGPSSSLFELEKELAKSIEGAVATAEARRVESGGTARPPKKEPATEAPSTKKAPATEATRGGAVRDEGTLAEGDPDRPHDPLGAAMAFSEGLDLLDRKDLPRARAEFQRALSLDPSLDDARSELAALTL